MADDLHALLHRIQALPDDALVRLLTRERDQYTPAALRIAEAEARGGLDALQLHAPPTPPAPARSATFTRNADRLLDRVIGRAPRDEQPALSYVALALRLASFVIAAVALGSLGLGVWTLLTSGAFPGIASLLGAFAYGVGFLILFGLSELIHLVLDLQAEVRALRPASPAAAEDTAEDAAEEDLA